MKRPFSSINLNRWLKLFSALTFVVAILSLVLVSRQLYAAIKTQEVNVIVQTQPESPLILTIISITPSSPRTPEFSYAVVNGSSKAVSAYAIRHTVKVGGSQTSGVTLTSMRSASSLLYQQARIEESFMGVTYAADVGEIVLSADFVEFEDGTTWGADTFKMSEKLAGRRAGGQAALRKLRELSRIQGLETVFNIIDGEIAVAAPFDKSQLWREGFDEGVRIVQVKLRHTKSKKGNLALEQELLEPFDVSERRQQP
jgi:hypothetical protein